MAQIDIRRPHTLTLAQARKEADVLAEHLKQEFDLESRWSGNKLSFKRRGVDGVMTVSGKDVHVAAELGFLVSLLKPKIEARLNAHLNVGLRALSEAVAAGKLGIDADGLVRLRKLEALPEDAAIQRSRDAMFSMIGRVQFGDMGF